MSALLLKRVCAGIALIAYSYLVLFGLLSMHHHDANMANCPYMIGQHSICQMDAMVHLQAWKDASTSILPTLSTLLFTSVFFAFIYLWYISPPRFLFSRQRYKTVFSPLHQYLFSQGILHPKAP